MNEIIKLELTEEDAKLLPCPFCGREDMELSNTWTASYWIECECGAKLHPSGRNGDPDSVKAHQQSKDQAISMWNIRAKGG